MRSPTVTWLDRPPVPAPSGDSLTDMATPRRRASSVPPLCGPSGIRGGGVELPVPARRPAVAGTGRECGDQLPALVPGPEPALGGDVAEGAEVEGRDVPGRGESPVGLRLAVEVVAAGEEEARHPERAGLQLAPGAGRRRGSSGRRCPAAPPAPGPGSRPPSRPRARPPGSPCCAPPRRCPAPGRTGPAPRPPPSPRPPARPRTTGRNAG